MDRTLQAGRSGASMWPWLAWAVVLVVVDQITKTLILNHYQLGDSTFITSFFNIVRAHNTGAAFSFLSDAGGWQRWLFTGIGVAATIFIVWQLRAHPGQKLFGFALSSILGGAAATGPADARPRQATRPRRARNGRGIGMAGDPAWGCPTVGNRI